MFHSWEICLLSLFQRLLLQVCVLEVSSWGGSVNIPIVRLRGEVLPPSKSPEFLLLFSGEPELCFKTLNLVAARDPSNLCITGVTVGLVLGCPCKLLSVFIFSLRYDRRRKTQALLLIQSLTSLKQQEEKYILKSQDVSWLNTVLVTKTQCSNQTQLLVSRHTHWLMLTTWEGTKDKWKQFLVKNLSTRTF